MTEETWNDLNKHVKAKWKAETTPFERVYEVVEQTHDGQSAADIAERALVSEPTARRHCKALVNTGFAEAEQEGRSTIYKRNADRVLMTRIRELRRETTREELLDGIKRMKREIRRYEDQYDVVSPEELARELDADDGQGWEDLSTWRTTRQNLSIAQAALAYSEASQQLTA
ncbi:winged helix-turn-helix domain-containing protein [Natronosalvus halobius]|uniref:winged helix-turn-helix domain-containing protein n=1 Tax=Natronosalvus halobius TaxID=2953746 RepID=UPI00209E8943|nr:winged helix-turn-helix domain-containing protein [Natronosalvus halobius]USZ71498.1 winged helix-turn-helix domain-containing protein [Natronosalvus halobius]